MKRHMIGIDQGTTATLVIVMDEDGQVVASADKAHQQFYPHPGWVEQDAVELYRNACELVTRVVEECALQPPSIVGIGIANQGESIVMWDRQTGQPLSRVVVWQDSRAEDAIERLAADPGTQREVTERTGLKLDSYFSASKMNWLIQNIPDAQTLLEENRLACSTLDTWLIWKLTEGRAFVTDVSTASRTLLFNIHTLEWDSWLLELFEIPRDVLPDVLESTGHFGTVSDPAVPCQDVPIVASLVDQPAAMVGQGCISAGGMKATFGTGCFINLNTGQELINSQHGLLTMLAWQRDGLATYGLDGGVFTAAATINWLRDRLRLISDAAEIDSLCASLDQRGQELWIPAQIGLGAPYWSRNMRGAWLGIDFNTDRARLIRAVLEGIAARVSQLVHAMLADSGMKIEQLHVDGGLTNSKSMMQIQADLLGYPVAVLENPEATATGACVLVARATDTWDDDQVYLEQIRTAARYEPAISEDERRARLAQFDSAVKHLEAWHRDG